MSEGISVLFGDQYLIVPSRADCITVVKMVAAGKQLSRGKQIVLALMLAGF